MGRRRARPAALPGGAGRRAAARASLLLRGQPGDVRAHRQLQDRPGACPGHPGEAGPMTIAGYSIATAPLLPWLAIIVFAALGLLFLAFGAWRRARGLLWRIAALLVPVLHLPNPSTVHQERQPQRDVAAVVVDDSPSIRIRARRRYAD